MKDPARLFDETDDELERLLLGAARAERSSRRARTRTLAALGITGSAALTASAAVATAAPLSAAGSVSALGKLSLTWAKLLLGLSALGSIAVSPVAYRAWQRHRAGSTVAARPALIATAGERPAAPPTMAPTLPAGSSTAIATATDSAATAQAAGWARAPDGAPSAAHLMRELQALDGARAALARGHATRALARLDGYAAAFPRGHLGLEAEILRIDALARGGHEAEVRARATAFLRDHPHSVLAARARRYLRQ